VRDGVARLELGQARERRRHLDRSRPVRAREEDARRGVAETLAPSAAEIGYPFPSALQ
jgi:hypothetical protein